MIPSCFRWKIGLTFYTKLGDYKEALHDLTSLIGVRLRNLVVFINLDFFRELYPEYAGVNDAKLKEKLHRMYLPNFSDDTFEKTITNPEGRQPSAGGTIRETYLKRADVLLALKRTDDARRDYARAEHFQGTPGRRQVADAARPKWNGFRH